MTEKLLKILMVDPSLFTAPYDEGITEGLEKNGIAVSWACRDLRSKEEYHLIAARQINRIFYPNIINSAKNAGFLAKFNKGVSHVASMIRLWRYVSRNRPDIVHFQWIVFPLVDMVFIAAIQRICPVIITVHDTLPFNGNPTSWLQTIGLSRALASVDHIIVHTQKAAEMIGGAVGNRTPVSVIAHGPLSRANIVPHIHTASKDKWNFLMFGKIQHYKGLDILVEALTLLPDEARSKMRIIVAGESFIDMVPIKSYIEEYKIGDTIDFRLWRHSNEEVDSLLSEADAFIFPYRRIDASGVLYLVAAYRKWIIASNIGIFREVIQENVTGSIIPAEDPHALAASLAGTIGKLPTASLPVESWNNIGKRTYEIYTRHISSRQRYDDGGGSSSGTV
ncbi:glycosyltransferase family 4 protein [Methylobacterium sp. E-041]|uniref:glycosyltransferase family 4 protein n=1 Tax=Methylobacterium sp. E-041 TaxID=2836573 RepID=UPI001FBBDD9D|nr:glycosyltransferase family 4 protein [Methylobacterium sp. E-041]MCJ2105101.1 glycosyltransferase family 4 protein [Methylobacterium sp. E-041]